MRGRRAINSRELGSRTCMCRREAGTLYLYKPWVLDHYSPRPAGDLRSAPGAMAKWSPRKPLNVRPAARLAASGTHFFLICRAEFSPAYNPVATNIKPHLLSIPCFGYLSRRSNAQSLRGFYQHLQPQS